MARNCLKLFLLITCVVFVCEKNQLSVLTREGIVKDPETVDRLIVSNRSHLRKVTIVDHIKCADGSVWPVLLFFPVSFTESRLQVHSTYVDI